MESFTCQLLYVRTGFFETESANGLYGGITSVRTVSRVIESTGEGESVSGTVCEKAVPVNKISIHKSSMQFRLTPVSYDAKI